MAANLSILLPFRDAAATLEEAARSVLADAGDDAELVAIDDGSTDDGAARLRALGDPRVVIVRAEGEGIAAALATGLAVARGARIARMDADDVSLPGRFAAQRALLDADARLAAVGARIEPFPTCGEGMGRYVAWQNALVTAEDHARELFVEAPLCHPSTLLRRAALEAVGGWRATPWPEDYDLWLRLDAAGWGLAKVPRVLLRWRQSASSVTRAHASCAPARLAEARARYLAPKVLASRRALVVWGAGQTGRRLARALADEGARAARFVDIDPRKVGRTRRGAPVVAPRAIDPERDFVVIAVGTRGARDVIRPQLAGLGLREGRDCFFAA